MTVVMAPWRVREDRTSWVAWSPTLTLADVLTVAEREHTTRIMLTGPAPDRAWFVDSVPGWSHQGHYLDADTPAGRYLHDAAAVKVELRRAAEWFGDGDYTPDQARQAWDTTRAAVTRDRFGLMRSPGATGLNVWLDVTSGRVPEPLDVDTQDLIRTTTPQHRIELRPPVADTMPALWVIDGRWMYAALTRELGAGPARMLTGAQAHTMMTTDPYARARYRVRWQAPDWWDRMPGLLMAHDGERWRTPPTGESWVDAAEARLALECDWTVTAVEGIAFTPGRYLDGWTRRLTDAREAVSDDELGPDVAALVRRAIRAVLLHAIGSWHSAGRDETTVTPSPMQPPPGDGWDVPERLDNGTALWRRRAPLPSPRALAMRHPEWSSQVWGRAHARMLLTPTADRAIPAGLLATPWSELVGVYGDAILTTRRPSWADPALDDGRPGRLRVKGHLCGPIPWPTRAADRDRLTREATANGPTCTRGCTP